MEGLVKGEAVREGPSGNRPRLMRLSFFLPSFPLPRFPFATRVRLSFPYSILAFSRLKLCSREPANHVISEHADEVAIPSESNEKDSNGES